MPCFGIEAVLTSLGIVCGVLLAYDIHSGPEVFAGHKLIIASFIYGFMVAMLAGSLTLSATYVDEKWDGAILPASGGSFVMASVLVYVCSRGRNRARALKNLASALLVMSAIVSIGAFYCMAHGEPIEQGWNWFRSFFGLATALFVTAWAAAMWFVFRLAGRSAGAGEKRGGDTSTGGRDGHDSRGES